MLNPGRPKKTEPKLILGLFSLPFSGEEMISEYLRLKYNFTIVSLKEISEKYRIDNNKEDLSCLNILEKEGDEFLIRRAIHGIRKAGRPLALIQDFDCGKEIDFCKKDDCFFLVSLISEDESRWRRFLAEKSKGETVSLDDFKKETKLFLEMDHGEGRSFQDYLYKSDFRVEYNGSLSKIYEEIERILEKISEKNQDLKEIMIKRDRFSKK